MKPEIKKLWVEALRSGEYKQGAEWLRRGSEYCCLGVLCDIAIDLGAVRGEWVRVKGSVFYKFMDASIGLPDPVREWAGLRDSLGGIVEFERFGRHGHASLAELNDSGTSFAEIADVIEAQL